jgi:hypothetical protein
LAFAHIHKLSKTLITPSPPPLKPAPLPTPLGKIFLEAGLAAGRTLASLGLPFTKPSVQHLLSSGSSLRLQFPREDLGFSYTAQGAAVAHTPGYWWVTHEGHRVIPKGVAAPGSSSSSSSGSGSSSSSSKSDLGSSRGSSGSSSSSRSSCTDRGADYVPSTAEGFRLPHVPLVLLDQGGEEQKQVRPGEGGKGEGRAGESEVVQGSNLKLT